MVSQAGKYAKLKGDEEIEEQQVSSTSDAGRRDVESQQKPLGEKTIGEAAQEFTRKTLVVIALTILTSSQGLLIAVSKQGGKFEYSVMSANCMVETTKCVISLLFLLRQWNTIGVTEDNTLVTTLNEIWVFPVPALLYLIKNLMQYVIFLYVDPPSYQVLKNLNIITTGILYRIFLKKRKTKKKEGQIKFAEISPTTQHFSSICSLHYAGTEGNPRILLDVSVLCRIFRNCLETSSFEIFSIILITEYHSSQR